MNLLFEQFLVFISAVWEGMQELQPVEYMLILLLSTCISMLLFVAFSKEHKWKVVDLGNHKWLVK